jgi:hypothetical protein
MKKLAIVGPEGTPVDLVGRQKSKVLGMAPT